MSGRLAEIEGRLDASGADTWAWEPHGDSGGWSLGVVWGDGDEPLLGRIEPGSGEVVEFIADGGIDGTDADADLIAHTPTDMRDLLAVARAAETVIGAAVGVDLRSPDTVAPLDDAHERLRSALVALDRGAA